MFYYSKFGFFFASSCLWKYSSIFRWYCWIWDIMYGWEHLMFSILFTEYLLVFIQNEIEIFIIIHILFESTHLSCFISSVYMRMLDEHYGFELNWMYLLRHWRKPHTIYSTIRRGEQGSLSLTTRIVRSYRNPLGVGRAFSLQHHDL